MTHFLCRQPCLKGRGINICCFKELCLQIGDRLHTEVELRLLSLAYVIKIRWGTHDIKICLFPKPCPRLIVDMLAIF